MSLRNMLKICLVFWKSEPWYAYKLYAYKKKTCTRSVRVYLYSIALIDIERFQSICQTVTIT